MIFYRILSVCVFANIFCHLFEVSSSPTRLATDNTSLQPKPSTEDKKRKGLDIDLNFPPPVEEGMSKDQKRRKEMSKIYNAAQTAKRRERKRIDPEYAKRRREVERQSKQKSRGSVEKLEGEKKEEAILQRKIYNRTYYLKRKIKFDGHASKKGQEIAQTLQKMKKGEDVPVEDQQRALEFHEKRKRIQKESKARRRQKDAMAPAQAQTRSS